MTPDTPPWARQPKAWPVADDRPAPSSGMGSPEDEFLARLPAAVQLWQDRGIITAEQGRAMVSAYRVPGTPVAVHRTQGRLVTILSTLGSVLVGLGVILFFAANWQEIPRPVKLAMILIAIPAVYGIGYWLRYLRGYQRVGTAVILLACLLYGAGIHLVAQAYNIPVNDPKLFLYWFVGVLALAYLTRSQVILYLGVGLFLAAAGFRLADWLDDVDRGVVAGAFSLYLVLGVTLYALGKLQAQFGLTRSYAKVYEDFGLVTALGSLYLLTFREWFDDYRAPRVEEAFGGEFWIAFYAAAGLAIAVYGVLLARLALHRPPWQADALESGAALLLVGAAVLVVNLEVGGDIFYPILFNALLVLGMLGLLFSGYLRGQESLINIALAFFILDVISRYFEFGWSLLDRSLVFIVAGAILLGGGFLLERGRRHVFQRMRGAGGLP